jgi:phage-related protein
MDRRQEKPLVWLHGEIKTPPFSSSGRIAAGVLLRRLQRGEELRMPHSRPMPTVGAGCHELRIPDERRSWRGVYCVADEAIVILHVFAKRSRKMPKRIIEVCRRRLRAFVDSEKDGAEG